MTRYNKWHVKEIYCNECYRCLNQQQVRERTRLAEMAAKEGKINEFYMGTYVPSESFDTVDNESEEDTCFDSIDEEEVS